MFVKDQSRELRFVISAPPPDGGVGDGGRDMAQPRRDGGSDAGSDAGRPQDLAPGKG